VQLTPQQAEFVRSQAARVAMVGGRGSGKTWAGAYRVLRWARSGCTYLVVAPTYTMLRDFAWPTVLRIARALGMLAAVHPSRMAMTIVARGGGPAVILFRSADQPDRLRGLSVSGVWLDEASLMPHEVYEVVLFTLREAPKAWLAATFTPKGRRHWTYEKFARPGADCHMIHAPTCSNLFLPSDFLQTVRQEATGRLADQELEGLFVDLEGVEWPAEFWGDWVFVPQLPPRQRWAVSAVAVDPSLGKQDKAGDYSAIVLVAVCDDLLWIKADLQRRSPQKLVADVMVACSQDQPDLVGFEANQFQELLIHEFNRAADAQFKLRYPIFQIQNRVNKLVRIRRLGPYITRRELRVVDDVGGRLLLQQLQEFPVGQHDDGPDALEMAIRLILEASGGFYADERDGT